MQSNPKYGIFHFPAKAFLSDRIATLLLRFLQDLVTLTDESVDVLASHRKIRARPLPRLVA